MKMFTHFLKLDKCQGHMDTVINKAANRNPRTTLPVVTLALPGP